jgi:TonB family protein
MRKAAWPVILLALTACPAWAQQELAPSTEDGPVPIKAAQPAPDKDGVYSAGPGIAAPIAIQRVAIPYPADAPAEVVGRFCMLSLVVGADGVPADIQVIQTRGAAIDAAAVAAVKQTKFEPGTLDGKPVSVRLYAGIRFRDDKKPAFPIFAALNRPGAGSMQPPGASGVSSRPVQPRTYDKPPVITFAPGAEFSDQARREKIQGVVIVSVMVTEDGLPVDVRIEKSVGHGLDENALQSVSKYRFKPAMKDGKPVAARVAVEVNFRLY